MKSIVEHEIFAGDFFSFFSVFCFCIFVFLFCFFAGIRCLWSSLCFKQYNIMKRKGTKFSTVSLWIFCVKYELYSPYWTFCYSCQIFHSFNMATKCPPHWSSRLETQTSTRKQTTSHKDIIIWRKLKPKLSSRILLFCLFGCFRREIITTDRKQPLKPAKFSS